MGTIVATVSRGSVTESAHCGHIAVCDSQGRLIAWAGEPDTVTYFRSAAKPLQALNVILSGAAEKFQMNRKELSILCASHYGEPMHRAVIHGLLRKMGLPVSALLCGAPLSISGEYRRRQLWEHHDLDPSNSDCSGKHCGFLAVCLTRGYPIETYNRPEHPAQREVLRILSDFTDLAEEEIPLGVDGCGVPVHALSVRKMAMAYARFSSRFAEQYRPACGTLFDAMNAEPEMVAGTGGFCTEFLKATHGRFCGKLGAESVYCVGVKDRNMGIAVKIADGSYRALYPVVISALNQLGLLSEEENAALAGFAHPEIRNNLGDAVGRIEPAFTLRR